MKTLGDLSQTKAWSIGWLIFTLFFSSVFLVAWVRHGSPFSLLTSGFHLGIGLLWMRRLAIGGG